MLKMQRRVIEISDNPEQSSATIAQMLTAAPDEQLRAALVIGAEMVVQAFLTSKGTKPSDTQPGEYAALIAVTVAKMLNSAAMVRTQVARDNGEPVVEHDNGPGAMPGNDTKH